MAKINNKGRHNNFSTVETTSPSLCGIITLPFTCDQWNSTRFCIYLDIRTGLSAQNVDKKWGKRMTMD